ncbi:MAG: aminopeptidase P family protein [Anaerolineae bacterium]|nr:aminopeptidase P family protein [Anaerolineae bacterium]
MRIIKLREKMQKQGLDGMLITDPQNRRYLSGFTGSTATLLVTAEQQFIMVDFRYFERAERESPQWAQVRVTGKTSEALADMVRLSGARQLGFEADHVTVAQWEEMRGVVGGVELAPTKQFVLPMRAIKDEGEVAAIQAAIACSDAAFARLCQVIRPGMTEIEVAWTLESYMRQHGASELAFPTIVGAGPNGAMPHATSSERPIRAGEPIVMDFGATVDGYRSDITRTICLGKPEDAHYLEIWNLVLQAQQAAETHIKPGMTGQQADAVARDLFVTDGYGEQFGHGLGHGVGLNIHEGPRLGKLADEDVLQPGMVFTIEPGLYLPGWGGVRIEDVVLLREDGCEVLTGAVKEPVLE